MADIIEATLNTGNKHAIHLNELHKSLECPQTRYVMGVKAKNFFRATDICSIDISFNGLYKDNWDKIVKLAKGLNSSVTLNVMLKSEKTYVCDGDGGCKEGRTGGSLEQCQGICNPTPPNNLGEPLPPLCTANSKACACFISTAGNVCRESSSARAWPPNECQSMCAFAPTPPYTPTPSNNLNYKYVESTPNYTQELSAGAHAPTPVTPVPTPACTSECCKSDCATNMPSCKNSCCRSFLRTPLECLSCMTLDNCGPPLSLDVSCNLCFKAFPQGSIILGTTYNYENATNWNITSGGLEFSGITFNGVDLSWQDYSTGNVLTLQNGGTVPDVSQIIPSRISALGTVHTINFNLTYCDIEQNQSKQFATDNYAYGQWPVLDFSTYTSLSVTEFSLQGETPIELFGKPMDISTIFSIIKTKPDISDIYSRPELSNSKLINIDVCTNLFGKQGSPHYTLDNKRSRVFYYEPGETYSFVFYPLGDTGISTLNPDNSGIDNTGEHPIGFIVANSAGLQNLSGVHLIDTHYFDISQHKIDKSLRIPELYNIKGNPNISYYLPKPDLSLLQSSYYESDKMRITMPSSDVSYIFLYCMNHGHMASPLVLMPKPTPAPLYAGQPDLWKGTDYRVFYQIKHSDKAEIMNELYKSLPSGDDIPLNCKWSPTMNSNPGWCQNPPCDISSNDVCGYDPSEGLRNMKGVMKIINLSGDISGSPLTAIVPADYGSEYDVYAYSNILLSSNGDFSNTTTPGQYLPWPPNRSSGWSFSVGCSGNPNGYCPYLHPHCCPSFNVDPRNLYVELNGPCTNLSGCSTNNIMTRGIQTLIGQDPSYQSHQIGQPFSWSMKDHCGNYIYENGSLTFDISCLPGGCGYGSDITYTLGKAPTPAPASLYTGLGSLWKGNDKLIYYKIKDSDKAEIMNELYKSLPSGDDIILNCRWSPPVGGGFSGWCQNPPCDISSNDVCGYDPSEGLRNMKGVMKIINLSGDSTIVPADYGSEYDVYGYSDIIINSSGDFPITDTRPKGPYDPHIPPSWGFSIGCSGNPIENCPNIYADPSNIYIELNGPCTNLSGCSTNNIMTRGIQTLIGQDPSYQSHQIGQPFSWSMKDHCGNYIYENGSLTFDISCLPAGCDKLSHITYTLGKAPTPTPTTNQY